MSENLPTCDQCQRQFKYPSELTHNRLVDNDDQWYVCPTCNKTFKSKAGNKLHFKQHDEGAKVAHSIETDYKCAMCGAMFSNKSNLIRHVRLCKKEEYTFPCTFPGCGKTFITSRYVQEHAKVRKPPTYKCLICVAAF